VRDQVSHPYETAGKIIVLYAVSPRENKSKCKVLYHLTFLFFWNSEV
jgi:hypothetical protein